MPNEPMNAPRYLQVNPRDNVAIVVNEGRLPARTRFVSGLELIEDIPEAHKVALIDIQAGASILRYGAVIGFATEPIARGSWVHDGRMRVPAAPPLDSLPRLNPPIPAPMPIVGRTFQGFLNDDGSIGTKNILGIATTVQCVAATVDFAVKRIKSEILPRYSHVDDVISLTHNYGCGVAIHAPGAEIPIRTLRNLSLNPNLGGSPMVVSLGCEKLQPQRLLSPDTLPILAAAPYIVRLQDEEYRSFGDMVAAIMELAEKRLSRLINEDAPCNRLSPSSVGVQCGGSDAMSGATANPAVGCAADLLVRAGATVLFSEVTEVRDALHLMHRAPATRRWPGISSRNGRV